ncbi:MAG: hypothetical protein ACOYBW_01175 [Fluviibacter phosphoraccumulans]
MKLVYPLIALTVTACAGADVRPVVDMQGVNSTKYEADLRDCQEYAKQKSGALETGAKGAAGGAVVGSLIGLVGGGTGSNIAQAAGVGAVVGAAGGGYMGNKAQEDIVKKCLAGRGYKVLD